MKMCFGLLKWPPLAQRSFFMRIIFIYRGEPEKISCIINKHVLL